VDALPLDRLSRFSTNYEDKKEDKMKAARARQAETNAQKVNQSAYLFPS
jgi:hypothetical protein